jgi:hypothetical protein
MPAPTRNKKNNQTAREALPSARALPKPPIILRASTHQPRRPVRPNPVMIDCRIPAAPGPLVASPTCSQPGVTPSVAIPDRATLTRPRRERGRSCANPRGDPRPACFSKPFQHLPGPGRAATGLCRPYEVPCEVQYFPALRALLPCWWRRPIYRLALHEVWRVGPSTLFFHFNQNLQDLL